jgi:hypothetical protein
MAAGNKSSKIIIIIPPSLSLLSLRFRGITSPEKTAEGYELRSRGPASQGFGALDKVDPQLSEKAIHDHTVQSEHRRPILDSCDHQE